MGVLTLLRPEPRAGLADRLVTALGLDVSASSGVPVTDETAMRVSAVYRCVAIIAGSIAALPLVIYRRRADGGKDRAPEHPLYDLLHDAPNPWQTAFEWREYLQTCALLRGNGYARPVPGPRGAVDQLVPLHPDQVQIELLANGGHRYRVRNLDGTEEVLNADQLLHLRGPSLDGHQGLSIVRYAREAIGLARAAEEFGARFFGQGMAPSGVLEHPGVLSDQAREHLRASQAAIYAGLTNAHKLIILEEGMKWHQVTMTAEDAQFLETRSFTVEDIARWFGVPNHMIGAQERATSWGSGIEQMSLGFVIYTLLPWLRRWEQAINKTLIVANRTFFAEFVVDALLRGDTLSRYQAYQIAAGGNAPWMTRNEIRLRENLNPDPELDRPLVPLNMAEVGMPREASASPEVDARLRQFLRDAAARIVRREMRLLREAARRCGASNDLWREAVIAFYREHAPLVAETLHISQPLAERYCAQQRDELLFCGLAAMQDWGTRRVEDLARLAMEEQDADG